MVIAILREAREFTSRSLSSEFVKTKFMDNLDNIWRVVARHEGKYHSPFNWGEMGSQIGAVAPKLCFAFFILLLFSGCMMTEDPEPQTQETQAPSITVSEKQAEVTYPAIFAEPDPDHGIRPEPSANKILSPANKIPSTDEIRLLQARMKAVGFDPGPIDGAMGPKTEKALRRFQLACTTLSDLLGTPETESISTTADGQAPKLSVTTNQTPNKDKVRLLQARMKAVGFDPGPIDGIMGPKTRSELVSAQSGCSMLKSFPAISDQELHILDKQVPARPSPKKLSRPVAAPSTTPVNKKSGPQNISRKPWLVPKGSD